MTSTYKYLKSLRTTVVLLSLTSLCLHAQQVVNLNETETGYINSTYNGGSATITKGFTNLNFVGAMNATDGPDASRQVILAFDLPVLTNAVLDTATLSVATPATSTLVGSSPWFNIDVYAFAGSSSTSFTTADYFLGSLDSSKTLVAGNWLTPTSVGGGTYTIDLTSLIGSYYAGATPGASTTRVFIRFNGDPSSGSYAGDDGFGRYRPSLSGATLSLSSAAIPEPGSYALLCGVLTLGFVATRRMRF